MMRMKKILFTFLSSLFLFCALGQSFPRVLVPYRIGNKWGYSDTLGKIKIPVKYDSAPVFDYSMSYNGRAIVILPLSGKPTAINDLGTVLVPAKYDHISPIQFSRSFAFFVGAKNKLGI